MSFIGSFISIQGVSFLTLSLFLIASIGYLLGRISIKGVSLGTAGVFVVALIYGCIFYNNLTAQLTIDDVSYIKEALKLVENIGLVLFVTSVGFIAGPSFFKNLKKNFKSYILLGLVIIISASIACILCIIIGRGHTALTDEEFKAVLVGIMSGALTSTPAFSASKEAVGTASLEDFVTLGYGVSYLFGVIGVVLFVQLIPTLTKSNIEREVEKIKVSGHSQSEKSKKQGTIEIDKFGLMPFSLAIIAGILIGSLKIKGFSLTTTGGCILSALILGHFGKAGRIIIAPKETTLRVLRELGLVFFLIGAGISGGARFIQYFKLIYFVYGIIITIVPMVAGYLFAKYALKMPLLNNLGSITGGMTSTPALGTLIQITGTEEISASYAATYPIALIAVVVASKLIIMFV